VFELRCAFSNICYVNEGARYFHAELLLVELDSPFPLTCAF